MFLAATITHLSQTPETAPTTKLRSWCDHVIGRVQRAFGTETIGTETMDSLKGHKYPNKSMRPGT